ncbi:unnamed protein product [Paramecium pentaurelia]|uniref:RING-type domain-containing protein n=1 Tax=Paramecium pentaurelia TaxID=43138 RepID=A0A8S1RUL7_9CILI|nr:unnamed protein product [Paramecium pentaurelia]
MYYPYSIEESEENISGDILNNEMDLNEDENQIQTYSYYTPSHSVSSQYDDDEEEEYVIDQSRIFNLAEVKVFLDEVICPICCHIIVAPKICKECDQSFCSRCIEKWFQKSPNQQCPCCRKSQNYKSNFYFNQGIMDGKVPKVLLKLLSKLLLTCRYSQEGCEEIITYDFREKHENNYCQYQEQDCPNHGCYETMLRKDLEEHYLECKYGSVQCKYCSQDKLRMDIESHLEECYCRPILCEWCQEEYQAIDFDKHYEQCDCKEIYCRHCGKNYKKHQMEVHTPEFCLQTLYQNCLVLLKQKDQQIAEQQKYIEFLESRKLIEQSDLNQSTNEVLSEKYKQDFEEEVEEIIEEDIQIEESDQEQIEQVEKDNKNQLSQDENENLDKKNVEEKQYDFVEIQPIQDIRMGMYTELLQRLNDTQLKDLWDWQDDEFNTVIDWFK